MKKSCLTCANAEGCAKNIWLRCKFLEGWVPVMGEELTAMDKSIKCLALELPEAVWEDVNKKWQELKVKLNKECETYKPKCSLLKCKHDHPCDGCELIGA